MARAKVKLGLNGLNVPAKVQFASEVVIKMTGNPNFTTPNPALPDVTTGYTDLQTAYNDAQQARLTAVDKTNTQNSKEADLDQLLAQLGTYVENQSNGDANIIMSSGMKIAATPTPAPVPDQVIIQTVTNNSSGKLYMKWKKVQYAKTYVVQQSTDINNPTKWQQLSIVTKTTYQVKNLTSGQKYWFRVQAIGTAGDGPWSDPYVNYAP
jgi:hypothetical protein